MNKKKNSKKNRSLEDNNEHSSSKGKLLGNSPKRNNVHKNFMESVIGMRVEDTPASGNLNVENRANQVVVETLLSSSNVESYNRLDFVKS